MTANRGARTFLSVFLLCCWQDVQPWPNREFSGSSDKQWPNLETVDDEIATVFDEILVQEILEPGKALYFENQRPSTTSQQNTTKEIIHMKESTASMRHQKQLSSGTMHIVSFDDKQKETLLQLRSLEALEKMIHKIRRAIEIKLKRQQKFQRSRTRQLLGKLVHP
ncbi:sperm acrosome-associated protein 7-like isoform X2 [Mastomys coucha]|uniref:sperm acrosome-associated protein 7-like isoform X2 n=1 Tax=Mastomys coucha TaxID=35658 RepID=UPI001261B4CB|nr:sperm acrosome-associated protein 7-like isoform X2 [Mastomys coucha]